MPVVDHLDLERRCAAVLESWPAVRAAWLIGSQAVGTAGPLSDVDVAILGTGDFSLDDLALLTVQLERAVGGPCDVVVAETASPVMGREIVDTGRRFFCRDADAADAWEDLAVRRFLDTAYLRKIVYQSVRADLQTGRR